MFRSVNPATGEELAAYPELNETELDARLQKAMSAFRLWRTTDLADRSLLLAKIADRFEENRNRLALMATSEMGKTYASAIAEVEKCVAGFRYYAEHGPSMLAPARSVLSDGGAAEICWLPQGPVLAVMPWNFPYWQVVRFLAPTIMAGNVGVLKHASNVQGVAELIEEMTRAAGAPEGLFQNLAIKSAAVAGVIAGGRIVAVTLTGSEGAGVAVAAEAGRNLKKVLLELGGSDPFIVMPSADLDEAVGQAVKARIQNAGQSCICAKRIIVHAEIYDAFIEKFAALMKSLRVGDPMLAETDLGPLSSAQQRDAVLGQIEQAKRSGARLRFGGERLEGPGAYLSPGLLTDVPLDSAIAREEIFGPVAMAFKAADIDEAIRIANDIPFGLGSSVWTRDPAEEQRFIRDIEAGMTAINEMLSSAPEAPFGGVKRSGYGRELGAYGLHAFMNLKTVLRARPRDRALVE